MGAFLKIDAPIAPATGPDPPPRGTMSSSLLRLWRELKRRKVFRVAGVYAATAFVVWQAAAIAFPAVGLPPWALTLVVMLALAGFPVALVLAWAFETTPDGVRRTDPARASSEGATGRRAGEPDGSPGRSRRLAAAVGGGVVLVLTALAAYAYLPAGEEDPAAPAERSIAVLPFDDLSREGDQAYFSDGITEDILTRLAQVSDLQVISRTSVMRYRDTGKSIPEIADELGVRYVLEGSVRKVGDELRITGQLIDARTDEHVWAESYDRDLTNVFEIQSEIASEIAGALEVQLSEEEREQLRGGGTDSPLAYDLHLRGRDVMGGRAGSYERYVQKVRTARTLFRRALEADSTFAPARAALSFTFSAGSLPLDSDVRYDSALAHARAAVTLDPRLPDAHVALGEAHVIKDYAEAAYDHYRTALRLSPSHAGALRGLATAYEETGRVVDALAALKRVIAVDPNVSQHHFELGWTLAELRFFDRGEAALRRAVQLPPAGAASPAADSAILGCGLARLSRARRDTAGVRRHLERLLDMQEAAPLATECAIGSLLWLGNYRRAGPLLRRVLDEQELPPDDRAWRKMELALVHRETGRPEAARPLLEDAGEVFGALRGQSPELENPLIGLAGIHALRGERDEAVALLRDAYRRHGLGVGAGRLRGDPLFRGLAGHPGYEALLGEMEAELDRMRRRAEREGLVG